MLMKFYKNKSLKTEKDWYFLEKNLHQLVFLPTSDQFNDPYEGQFILKHPPEHVLSNPNHLNFVTNYKSSNGVKLTEEDIIGLQDSEVRKKIESQVLEKVFKEHGVLCLTDRNDTNHMGGYYGDHHTGYCLEFELDLSCINHTGHKLSEIDQLEYIRAISLGHDIISKHNTNGEIFLFGKVNYSNSFSTVELEKTASIEDNYSKYKYLFQNSIGHKAEDWKHENEFRLVANIKGEIFLTDAVPFLRVSGVVCGLRMDPNTKKMIMDLCRKYNIKVYNAVMTPGDYSIKII